MGSPIYGKYNFPKDEVLQALLPHLELAMATGSDLPVAAEEIYNLRYVPMTLAAKMNSESVHAINNALAAMADCGCSGRRKSLVDALRSMNGVTAFREATAGVAQIADNAKVAAARVVSNVAAVFNTNARDSTRLHSPPEEEDNSYGK